MSRNNLSVYVAEFIGTFFLVFLGCGSIVINQINAADLPSFAIPVIFGGTVSIMIYAVGHISGAHFNPAVTLAFTLTRKFPMNRVAGYFAAQFSGAVLASFIHKIVWPEVSQFGITTLSTSSTLGFGIEFILSFLLMFVIVSVATDTRAVGELAGLAIGATVTLAAFFGGPLSGASMNPARSLAPALVSGEFKHLWIYFVATCLGAIIGAVFYETIRCEATTETGPSCC